MASDMPGQGASPEQPEPTPLQPSSDQAPAPSAPAWATPPPPSQPADTSIPGWGAQPPAGATSGDATQPTASQPASGWGSAPQAGQPAPSGAIPGWGTQPQAAQQPTQPAPQPTTWGSSTSQPQAPSSTSWGASSSQPQAPATTTWGASPSQPAQQPTGWGTTPPQPAAQPQAGWGAQPAPEQTQPQAQATGGWGTTPPQPSAPAQQPAEPASWGGAPESPVQAAPPAAQPQAQGGWNAAPQQPAGWGGAAPQPAPPAPMPAPQPAPQPQWASAPTGPGWSSAPPPQAPGPQPGWGGPGQPGFAPGPAQSSGNGCLKGCLIVGVLLVVVAIVGVIGITVLGFKLASDIGVDPNSPTGLKDCPIVSTEQLKPILGADTEAHPLSGLIDATVGMALDKRVLANAQNCWVGASGNADATPQPGATLDLNFTGGFGRIAKYSGGDAGSVFAQEKANAQKGSYFAVDVPNAGDQAFCTAWSDQYPATGALVRKGNDLVYVSFLIGGTLYFDETQADSGATYSPKACSDAVMIAELAFH